MMTVKFDAQADRNGFYNAPQMMGHRWAAENLDNVAALYNKVVKTDLQASVFDAVVDKQITSWSYWCNITKKDISQWSYVLRRLGKVEPLTLLVWLGNKSGCLKSHLYHIIEHMAYQQNQEAYLEYYVAGFRFFGMDRNEAIERFHGYHADISEKIYVKMLAS